MNEFHVEQLVKTKCTVRDKFVAIGPLFIGGLYLVKYGVLDSQPSNFNLIMIALSLLIVIISIIGLANLDKEYEYTCTSGDFDFDKVIKKSKRKHLFSISAEDIVILAPMGTREEVQYKDVKTHDFSSGEAGRPLYKLVAKQGENMLAIVFEPSPEILEKVWTSFPRKVVK